MSPPAAQPETKKSHKAKPKTTEATVVSEPKKGNKKDVVTAPLAQEPTVASTDDASKPKVVRPKQPTIPLDGTFVRDVPTLQEGAYFIGHMRAALRPIIYNEACSKEDDWDELVAHFQEAATYATAARLRRCYVEFLPKMRKNFRQPREKYGPVIAARHEARLRTMDPSEFAALEGKLLSAFKLKELLPEGKDVLDAKTIAALPTSKAHEALTVFRVAASLGYTPKGIVVADMADKFEGISLGRGIYIGGPLSFKGIKGSKFCCTAADRGAPASKKKTAKAETTGPAVDGGADSNTEDNQASDSGSD